MPQITSSLPPNDRPVGGDGPAQLRDRRRSSAQLVERHPVGASRPRRRARARAHRRAPRRRLRCGSTRRPSRGRRTRRARRARARRARASRPTSSSRLAQGGAQQVVVVLPRGGRRAGSCARTRGRAGAWRGAAAARRPAQAEHHRRGPARPFDRRERAPGERSLERREVGKRPRHARRMADRQIPLLWDATDLAGPLPETGRVRRR